jgi:hypothetical protein
MKNNENIKEQELRISFLFIVNGAKTKSFKANLSYLSSRLEHGAKARKNVLCFIETKPPPS